MKDALPGTSSSKGLDPTLMLLPPNRIYGGIHCPAELKNGKKFICPFLLVSSL